MTRMSPESIARNLANANARITENRARASAFKARMQCADCPPLTIWPACALAFDHRPGVEKYRELARMMNHSWEKIAAEIEKCDVVCHNHHSIRTASRLRVPRD